MVDKVVLTVLRGSALNHSEVLQLASQSYDLVAGVQKVLKSPSLSATRLSELVSLLGEFETEIHRSRESKLAKELDKADGVRDEACSFICRYFDLYAKSSEPNRKAAYDKLAPHFKGVLKSRRLSYEKESEVLKHFIKELTKDSNREAVDLLGLRVHLVALQNAQTAFDAVYQSRIEEVNASVAGRSRLLRNQVWERYSYMVTQVEQNAYGFPEQTQWADLLGKLNALRKRFKKTKRSKKTEETPSTEEAPSTEPLDN